MQPKLATHLLRDTQAQIAQNVRVEKSDLRSFNRNEIRQTIVTAQYKSLNRYSRDGEDSNWLYSTNDLDYAQSPIASDQFERLYYTGEAEPRAHVNNIDSTPFDQTTDFYKFGPAVPLDTGTWQFVSGEDGGSKYRAYVYTYVSRYGEETGPIKVLLETEVYDTGNVVITDFTQPPAGFGLRSTIGGAIPYVRIYRTNSSASGAEFQYVGEFNATTHTFGTSNFTDDVADGDLGEVLPTTIYEGIPTGLKGLIGLTNGIFAGFVGNQVYFSEQYLPHAWPDEYAMIFDYDIVGLGSFGTTLVVLTEGIAYIITGETPATLRKQRVPGFYPCVSKRSIVSTVYGVFYASNDGLIRINYDGPKNLTFDYLVPLEWTEFTPTTMHGGFFNGKYFGGMNNDSVFILDVENESFVTVSEYYQAFYRSISSGNFFKIYKNKMTLATHIEEWEGDLFNFMYYTWKSKRFMLPADMGFTCAQVEVDGSAYADLIDQMEENNHLALLNAEIFAAGDLEDTFNYGDGAEPTVDPEYPDVPGTKIQSMDQDMTFNHQRFNGSNLLDLNLIEISSLIKFSYFVNGTLRFQKNVQNNTPFRLPPLKGRNVEVQLQGYIPVRGWSIAQAMKELN
jgi:hypothetical protein